MKLLNTAFIILSLSWCILPTSLAAESLQPPNHNFQIPPSPVYENRGAAPSANHVWVDGYWNWNGKDWVWHKGRYKLAIKERPPIKNPEHLPRPPSHRHVWIPGRWTLDNEDWTWQKGFYQQKPFNNAFWHAGYWRYQAPGWVWIEGHW